MTVMTHELAPAQAPPDPSDMSDYESYHTLRADETAALRGLAKLSPEGQKLFTNRERIGRDTFPIEGMVDIRSWQAGDEAIVVDSHTEPAGYDKLRDAFGREQRWKPDNERSVLESIYKAVGTTLSYDMAHVDTIVQQVTAISPDSRKANLGLFLEDGKGVCRHMALAASWLGGEAYLHGSLDGQLTAEVNQRNKDGNRDAHEWARYTSASGEVYIIDPAQNFFGTLAEASVKAGWEYFRPGEKEQLAARQAGGLVVEQSVVLEKAAIETVSDEEVELRTLSAQYSSTSHQFLGIIRDDEKMALHTPAQTRSLQKATERFFAHGSELLQSVVDVKGLMAAQEVAKIADALAQGLQIERDYPEGMIIDPAMAKAWTAKVCQAAGDQYGSNNPNQDFTYVNEVGPLLIHELDRLLQ